MQFRLHLPRVRGRTPPLRMILFATAAPLLGFAWAGLAAAFGLLWWRQTQTRNATSVDAGWSAAIGLVTLVGAIAATGSLSQRILLAAVALAWSGRLTWHLVVDRVLKETAEDGRYRALREVFGRREQLGFFAVYQFQAFLALGFATPFVVAMWHDGGVHTLQIAGIGLAAVSQVLEGVADRQLSEHRRDPQNRGVTCRRGFWRYSRHPNYFFEWLTWCGFGLVHAEALGWYAAIAPGVMYVFVRYFSGIPFTEKRALKTRGDDYRRYIQTTNAFFPGPPRTATAADADPLEEASNPRTTP